MKSVGHEPTVFRTGCILVCVLFICLALNSPEQCFASDYAKSCGVRTSYFIAKLYGVQPSYLGEIAGLIDLAKDGTSSLAGIYKGLSSLGLDPKGKHLGYDDLCSLRHPTILHLQMDWGPHLVIFGGIDGDKVTLIDPPNTMEMLRVQFLEKWDGAALIVLPPKPKKAVQSIPDGQTPLACNKHSQDLGEFTLPLVKDIEARFVIKNISSEPVQVGKLIRSCGCTDTSISKTRLMPSDEAKITCSVSNPGEVAGPQRYTVTVPVVGLKAKPLQLEFKANFTPLISVRPLRLYFGRILIVDMPSSMKVRVLKTAGKIDPEIIGCRVSAPQWVVATAKNCEVEVTILPQVPLGGFNENIEIDTNVGAINVPITGECVGGFRCVPNLLISYNSDEDLPKFTIVKTRNSACNLDELEFQPHEKDKLVIVPLENRGSSSERTYMLRLLDKESAGPYHVQIRDSANNESVTLNIVCLSNQH